MLDDPFEGIPPDPPGYLCPECGWPKGHHIECPGLEPTVAMQASRVLSEDFRRRLQRLEQEIADASNTEREAMCNWLGGMLHRPPLERPTPAFRPMRALVEALWWDLAFRTTDDDGDLSPRILDQHPWGEGSDA